MSEYMIPIAILFIAFLIKVPIAYSLLGTSVFYFAFTGMDIGIVTEKMISQLYFSYIIIAVPLFIFTANVLNSSTVTDHMFKFAQACIGKRRGALAHVNVLISLIFSGMTGSAFADASGLGKMEIESMEKDGYDVEFACAVTAASSTIGPVFPPSTYMVTFAMLSGASVGALLLGGMLPGIMLAVALMIYISIISKKRNYPSGVKFTFSEFMQYTWKALPALLTPVILIGGIYSGFVTPTEAGALASVYAIFIAIGVYKTMTLASLWVCIKDTAKQSGPIMMLICCSAPFSYIITISGLGDAVADLILGITTNPNVFMLICIVLFLILGMFLDSSTITYVVLPILLPVVGKLGIDLVHFGVVFVLTMMIGLCTPPYGMLCFISAGIVDAPLKGVFREVLPMVLALMVILLIVAYCPWFVTVIPSMMG